MLRGGKWNKLKPVFVVKLFDHNTLISTLWTLISETSNRTKLEKFHNAPILSLACVPLLYSLEFLKKQQTSQVALKMYQKIIYLKPFLSDQNQEKNKDTKTYYLWHMMVSSWKFHNYRMMSWQKIREVIHFEHNPACLLTNGIFSKSREYKRGNTR